MGTHWCWVVAMVWSGALLVPASAMAEEVARPNILWLTCEDFSPRLGCYGDDTVPTPNIDRLAREGVRYSRAFSTTGVCSPSRFSIITGLYPTQAGAQYMRTLSRTASLDSITPPQRQHEARTRKLFEATPPTGVRCFTEYLRIAGYYCTNNSKEDYQFVTPPTAWDESSERADYRNRGDGQPFFAVYNYMGTHESKIHGKRYSPAVVDRSKVRVPRYLPDTPAVREDIARYYDNIVGLDEWVGDQLERLEREGLSDSTVVFFYGDHGDGLPRGKRWVYDSGTRVPFIVRMPDGARAGEVDDRMVSFVDLAPTMLSLAGVERPDYLPGTVMVGPGVEPASNFVFMHRDRMDDVSHETIRSVRDARFRYVRNFRPQLPYLHAIAYRDQAGSMQDILRLEREGKLGADQWQWWARQKPLEELYDTQTDPDEVENLASDPRHLEKLAQLRAALAKWVEATGDPLAMPEGEVVATRIWPPEGEQPTTAQPQVEVEQLAEGRQRVTILCPTEGASLGYREHERGAWTVYSKPFETSATSLQVVAHRLGWKRSQAEFELSK